MKNGGALPPEVYEAGIVVASSNLPGVLNIKSLRPGTLVVDYSFPPVFRVDEAIKRFAESGDILFTTGGELRLPGVVGETIYLPEEVEDLDEGVQGAFMKFLGSRDKHEITGCVLVSLLTGMKPEVQPTLGTLRNEDALAHFRFLEEFGVLPARLQMSGYFLAEEGVKAFSRSGKNPSATA